MKIPCSNLVRTDCVQKLFLSFRTIFVRNMFSPCSAKRRASDKDLPVCFWIHFAPYFRDYLISSLPRVCRGCFFHLSFPPKKLLKKGSSVVLLTTSILKVTSKDMSCFEIGFTTQVLCLTPLHGKSNSLRSDAANHQIQICYGKKFTLNGAFSQFYELFCAKRWRYVPFFPRLLS